MPQPPAASPFLSLEGISKAYPAGSGSVAALQELSLAFGRGRIVGIFGNNGAGKTTLTRIVAGLVEPTRGSVRVGGAPPGSVRVGLVGSDERSFYARLSVRENLVCFGRLQGLTRSLAAARAREWAARLAFEGLLERPFQTLSAGEKQRVNLARGLLAEPGLLILDEATRQADPATVLLVRRILRELARERGTLVLYTGQEFQGLEEDCDEIVVLDRGRLLLAGPAREVLSRWAPSVRELLLRLSEGGLPPIHASPATPPAAAAPAAQEPRARGPGALELVATLVRRDRLIELSFRFELFLRFSLVVVWGLLFWFFSQLVDPHDPRLAGQPFGFLLFGLAALQLSQTCLLRMGQRLREEQIAGTLEPLVATGVAPARLLLASLAWPLGTLLAGLLLMFALAALAGGLQLGQADPFALALVLVLGCGVLAALGLVSAAFVLGFQRGDPVAALLNLASLVLAGAYFPREFLPWWVQGFSAVLPHTHLLAGLRAAAFSGAGFADPRYQQALTWLALEALVCVPLAALALRRALARARRLGSLCHA